MSMWAKRWPLTLQAPTLFTIAQDLTKMQVIRQHGMSPDVGMIKNGQVVTFKVDAFPRDTFTGRVSQIRMNATTVQNVVPTTRSLISTILN